MPIDTSMYNQLQAPRIESPLASLASVLPAIEGLQKNKLMQQQMADTETLNNLYKGAVGTDGKIDRTALLTGAAQGGLGSKIPGMQKQFAEADKETAAALKLGLENGLNQFAVIGQAMSGVRDQATYTSAKQQLASVFPEIAQKMPDVYDPGTIERNRARAVAVKDQMEQALKQLTLEETQRHNKSTESLTARGQNMVDARSREANANAMGTPEYKQDADGNWIALPKKVAAGQSIVAQPVMGVDGKPLSAAGAKLTEDQGKATGWLVQADNAFKNMRTALQSTPSAAKPGVADALAGIPSMGIGGAVGNMVRSPDRQKFLQGTSSLSEALLRAATGAGVNKDEAAQKVREITPVFGDSDAVIKQKMDAIPLYIESLKVRAGPGAKKAAAISAAPAAGTAKFLGFE